MSQEAPRPTQVATLRARGVVSQLHEPAHFGERFLRGRRRRLRLTVTLWEQSCPLLHAELTAVEGHRIGRLTQLPVECLSLRQIPEEGLQRVPPTLAGARRSQPKKALHPGEGEVHTILSHETVLTQPVFEVSQSRGVLSLHSHPPDRATVNGLGALDPESATQASCPPPPWLLLSPPITRLCHLPDNHILPGNSRVAGAPFRKCGSPEKPGNTWLSRENQYRRGG